MEPGFEGHTGTRHVAIAERTYSCRSRELLTGTSETLQDASGAEGGRAWKGMTIEPSPRTDRRSWRSALFASAQLRRMIFGHVISHMVATVARFGWPTS